MNNSANRILTTHVGSLVRPPDLIETLRARANGQTIDEVDFARRVKTSIGEVVQKQAESGIDIPSDGEYGKPNFSGYVNDRLSGFETRERNPDESPILNWGRDRTAFLEFYEQYEDVPGGAGVSTNPVICASPITYTGESAVQNDIETLRAALEGVDVEEAFIPAVAPGTIEGQRRNEHYDSMEDYLFGIADAMHEEYRAIVDAGFILQIDDPRIVVAYDLANPAPSVEEYRKFAELRAEATKRPLATSHQSKSDTTCAGAVGTALTPPISH
ncbi:MAG: hypothetical protein QF368_08585 [SAR202 cluster bacterium]|nr:hypothetical protein [SAR202 cluster bacterium]